MPESPSRDAHVTAAASSSTEEVFGAFPFGLSAEQEERARRLHADSLIVDVISEGPCGYRAFTPEMVAELQERARHAPDLTSVVVDALRLPVRMARKGELPQYREWWEASGVTGASREVFLTEMHARAFEPILAQFDAFPWLVKALHAEDFRRAHRDGLRAAFVNTQTSDGIQSAADVEVCHGLGLRMMQMTYNQMTRFACGCGERTDAGVTHAGARLIAQLAELGVILDVAHASRRTTLDACELTTVPLLNSHAGAAALCAHPRCKTDDELRAIAATGGAVGVVALPRFLSAREGISVEVLLDHVDYIADLVGVEHVMIATDWPMCLPKWVLSDVFPAWLAELDTPDNDVDYTVNIAGFDDFRDYPNITRGLVARGYGDEDVRRILGENFLRVFEAVCG
ncbi:MAG TPA: membrane dipeptidase [Conexibacter sp.]|jgi:membrane dipeptidase|nr:membrane dipeptidase [Conexibacter sp.]